jgi:NAD(P)-dependent dehydrogenase (short-subunit alcohol dehydrogenase family)
MYYVQAFSRAVSIYYSGRSQLADYTPETEMTSTQHLTPALLAQAVPLGRAGGLSDISGPILFLAGPAGAYVNGAVWLVDGGRVGSFASSYS